MYKHTKCVEGLVEADGSCTVEEGNVDIARRTIHVTHYVLGIHNCPAPPQTTCSGGRPIAPTIMWEQATGRFESSAATDADQCYSKRINKPQTSQHLQDMIIEYNLLDSGTKANNVEPTYRRHGDADIYS